MLVLVPVQALEPVLEQALVPEPVQALEPVLERHRRLSKRQPSSVI